jgi:hypothetical protein
MHSTMGELPPAPRSYPRARRYRSAMGYPDRMPSGAFATVVIRDLVPAVERPN